MIGLKKIDGTTVDLSVSAAFQKHYSDGHSFARYIIDNEINNGVWYDNALAAIPEDAVIVDAGFNVGLFSVYLSSKNRKFYCIEPSNSHLTVGKDLLGKLGINATFFEGVIYNMDGSVRLFADAENSTMNRVTENNGWLVNSNTLKTFFDKNNLKKVDLLKLDIEGSEQEVLLEDLTVDEPLKKCSVVFVETHDGMDGKRVNEAAIIARFVSIGFTHQRGKREASHYFIKN